MNIRHRTKVYYSVFILTIFAFSGCSMKQNLFLESSGSGRVTFNLELAPYFTEVADQLSELAPPEDGAETVKEGFFNTAKIRKDLSTGKGIILDSLDVPSDSRLTGEISFQNVEQVLAGDSGGTGIFSFKTVQGVHELSVKLSYGTVEKLLNSNPSFNTTLMQNFGPLANKNLTEEEYLEMMQFVLGDESRQGIKDSVLSLEVKVDGRIVSQSGGEVISSDTVKFNIPLLRILVINETTVFSVKFK